MTSVPSDSVYLVCLCQCAVCVCVVCVVCVVESCARKSVNALPHESGHATPSWPLPKVSFHFSCLKNNNNTSNIF